MCQEPTPRIPGMFPIPRPPRALVKVIGIDASGNQIPDQSNSVFTISKPGSNRYLTERVVRTGMSTRPHPITWSTGKPDSRELHDPVLDKTTAHPGMPVATNVPGTNTSYSWSVPDTPTTQALVKVIGIDALRKPDS